MKINIDIIRKFNKYTLNSLENNSSNVTVASLENWYIKNWLKPNVYAIMAILKTENPKEIYANSIILILYARTSWKITIAAKKNIRENINNSFNFIYNNWSKISKFLLARCLISSIAAFGIPVSMAFLNFSYST